MSGNVLLLPALVVYCLSTAGFLVYVIRKNKKAGRIANWTVITGFLLQTASLSINTLHLGQLPVQNLHQSLGFFGWTLVGGYLILYSRFRLPIFGAFVSPLAMVFVFMGYFLGSGQPNPTPISQHLWLTLHLAAAFTGYGFFGFAFVAAVMYLLQETQIKTKKTGSFFKILPSLNVLDSMSYLCIIIGLPLMTLGLISGMVYAQRTLGHYWRWDPKEVWALILWLFYAALLHQRLTVGWRGRRAAIMAIIGFSVLCFTFIGVSLVMPGYHSFENLNRMRFP